MSAPTFASARDAYWASVGLGGALPELPEEPFDAFVELLHLTSEAKDAFRLVDLGDDPYPGLSVGDTKKPWQQTWALQLSELEPFKLPSDPEVLFLADSIADAKGAHRVYTFADGVRGPIEFVGLAEALSWMAVRLASARGKAAASELEVATSKFATALEDPHESSTGSGFFLFEALVDAPFKEAWAAYANGEWVVPSTRVEPFRFQKTPGWERRLSLYLVQRFLERRLVDLPKSIKPTDLGAAHRGLVKHLQGWEESIHTGGVPELVDDVAGGSAAALAKLAVAWTERFEKSRGELDDADPDFGDASSDALSGSVPPPPDEDEAPKKKGAKRIVSGGPDAAAPKKGAAKATKSPSKASKGAKADDVDSDEAPAKASKGGASAAKATAAKAAPAKATSAPAKKVAKAAAVGDDLDADSLDEDSFDDDEDDDRDDGADDALASILKRAKPAPEADTPFLRKLREALTQIVAAMQREELVELEEAKRAALVAELVASAAEARSPAHLLRQVANTLVHSDNVEEVFASDDEIEHYLKKQLA